VVDSKAPLARDRLRQRRDCLFIQVLDGPAGGTDQVMVMTGLTPDIGGDVAWALEALRQSGANERLERSKHCGPADIGVLLADALVEFLRRRFLSRLRQHRGDGEPLRRQANARLLQGGLGGCLNHAQMILLSGGGSGWRRGVFFDRTVTSIWPPPRSFRAPA